jgi:ribosome-binding factor A
VKNRLDRVNELIKRELSDLILRECSFSAKLVTVQAVDIAPDLKNADVYISVIGTEAEAKEALLTLEDARKDMQSRMARRVILKYTPHLHFKLDESVERGDRVMKILTELNIPEEDPSSTEED